jgi:hypothetical protein
MSDIECIRLEDWIIGYTAGMLDGEGTIGLLYGEDQQRRKSRYRVQIAQADSNNGGDLCEWLRDTWNMGHVYRQNGLCPIHVWNVTRHNDIVRLLGDCLPFMRVKRSRAQEALDFLAGKPTVRRGIWTARELHIIRELGGSVSATDLAQRLQRSVSAVRAKRNELGVDAPEWHNRVRHSHYKPD